MPFALVVESHEAKAVSGTVLTKDGELFWACVEPEGWVEATSSRCTDKNCVPGDAKIFKNEEAAGKFAARWKGHPWWCKPNGNFEVIRVEPVYRRVLDGYRRKR